MRVSRACTCACAVFGTMQAPLQSPPFAERCTRQFADGATSKFRSVFFAPPPNIFCSPLLTALHQANKHPRRRLDHRVHPTRSSSRLQLWLKMDDRPEDGWRGRELLEWRARFADARRRRAEAADEARWAALLAAAALELDASLARTAARRERQTRQHGG